MELIYSAYYCRPFEPYIEGGQYAQDLFHTGADADDIGRQELEHGPRKPVPIPTPVHRVTPPVLHPQQFRGAFVELVIADRVVLETDQIKGLNGRLVMEERGNQRA